MIERDHKLPVTQQVKLRKVSRGSVYYLPKPVSQANLALMRRMGIEALAPQPGTSKATPGNKIYPYLLRKLPIVQANQVWALDTTYIPMARGFVYLTAVVDIASCRVLTQGADPTGLQSRWKPAMQLQSSRQRLHDSVCRR